MKEARELFIENLKNKIPKYNKCFLAKPMMGENPLRCTT
jgi:hypothetical protein